MSESESSDESMNGTPPDIRATANEMYETLVPQKSKTKYECTYKKFMDWTSINKIKSISENVVTAYMKKLSTEIIYYKKTVTNSLVKLNLIV